MRYSLILTIALTFILNTSNAQEKAASDNHKITIKEVIYTSNYTYLFSIEEETELWIAIPKMEAKAGEVYYYKGGFDMIDFKSTELKRTFDKVKFLGGVSRTPITTELGPQNNPYENKQATPHGSTHSNPHGKAQTTNQGSMPSNHPAIGDTEAKPLGKITSEKEEDIKLKKIEGAITIAELFKNKAKYEGKIVKIKGKVKKFTDSIMSKNWIHLQDGTEFDGKFDLTVTSQEIVKIDKVITIEGKIALNKDFGYGYKYDVLMEDAKIIK